MSGLKGPLDDINKECLQFIINHVFLPPKLPQKVEEGTGEKNSALLKLVHDVAVAYGKQGLYLVNSSWERVVRMLNSLGELENSNSLSVKAFRETVMHMGTGDVLALHISAQNAGIILRQSYTQMVFESFEASPRAADVIGTKGKLLCSYPGPAIAVDLRKAKDPAFLLELSSFLEKMKTDTLEQATPKSSKAGTEVSEERETSDPKFITEMFTGILRGIGSPALTRRIQKRIADDVLWNNARVPWRRSPLWLVVRVALQTTLMPPGGQHTEYKSFMVFLMTKILSLAVQQDFPSDILFVMNAKLSRRVYKARDRTPRAVLDKARKAGERALEVLNDRWAQAQSYHSKPLSWNPDHLKPDSDTQLTMLGSRDYILGARARKPRCEIPERKVFLPTEAERIDRSSDDMPQLKSYTSSKYAVEKDLALADFEFWVQENLGNWVAANLDREEACRELGQRMEDYISAAKPLYKSQPERISNMILTVMELWAALDKVTVKLYPLLSEYFPTFADGFLAPLLLPYTQQMIRLGKIEAYIKDRRAGAVSTHPSIFSDVVNEKTFAVQYFMTSQPHQDLELEIQRQAEEERNQKCAEFQKREEEYEKLLEGARVKSCDYSTNWQNGWTKHHRKCKKCALVRAAAQMKIEVHEWPLPADDLQCKTVVFELHCPLGFLIWRDMTYKVLVDICAAPQSSPNEIQVPHEYLNTFTGLKQYFDNSAWDQRLRWSSLTKSFRKSHYQHIKFPSTIEAVCVKNGLRYGLFDPIGKTSAGKQISENDIQYPCTFKLPDGPYKELQYSVKSTSHAPNQVLSRQSECPSELQLHEYLAFGLLRAGHRVQWLNIVRELRSRILTFSNDAVNMLFMQSAWQAGPSGTSVICRESHLDLEEQAFGNHLLFELEDMLGSIETNWQEVATAQTLITLAARLLSFSKHPTITKRAVEFLRKTRKVTLCWVRELACKLPDCTSVDMSESQFRVVQMAATCRTTYSVERDHLDDVLYSEDDVAVLIECATLIHHNTPATTDSWPRPRRALLDRDRRLSHTIESRLRSLILGSEKDLDLTNVWGAYKQGSAWKSLPKPNSRWVVTNTVADSENCSQEVYYNLLNGQFLVDGLPLGRMPSNYVSHPTYLELFGEKVLDLFQSRMGGMIYHTKQPMFGYEVSFVMEGGELVIRTRRESDSTIHQLIPRAKLESDFPAHIIGSHLHWLEVSSGKIELRDQESPWVTKPQSWYIHDSYTSNPGNVLYLGRGERLLDVRSSTASMITSVLCPLEYEKFIDIRISQSGKTSAHLPRLKLDFSINESKKLECRQFPRMVIDDDQSIGALIGLENMLVVCQDSIRSVIIPYGKVNFERWDSHIKVEIDTKDQQRVKYHIYTIDPILGRLVGNGSLASHLYKIYLHAVTAYCLPDPLTSRTGTEEALANLRAAATWSFQTLEKEGIEADLFREILSLTPKRIYYPPHLKLMQQVKWECLSPIVQHDEFHTVVTAVFAHASLFHMFEEDLDGQGSKAPIYDKKPSDSDLLARATIRNASYRTEQFGGLLETNTGDAIYSGRDTAQGSEDEARAWYISGLVERWPSRMNVCSQLMEVLVGWGSLIGPVSTLKLGYDQIWLNQSLAEVWCQLYKALTESNQQLHTYQLIFLLSALAYSGKVDLELIETLLAFATVPGFQDLPLPIYPAYDLRQGFCPDEEILVAAVKGCTKAFGSSDEANLLAGVDESELELSQRRCMVFNANVESESRLLVANLIRQWPCDAPSTPSQSYPHLDIPVAVVKVTPLFNDWYRNMQFEEHMKGVQNQLSHVSSGGTRQFEHYSFERCCKSQASSPSIIRLKDLFDRSAPVLPDPPSIAGKSMQPPPALPHLGSYYAPEEKPTEDRAEKGAGLEILLQEFRSRDLKTEDLTKFREKYAEDLRSSLKALQIPSPSSSNPLISIPADKLRFFEAECDRYLKRIFEIIWQSLAPVRHEVGDLMSYNAGLWPKISPVLLLQQLATNQQINLSMEWKFTLVAYGKAITMLQRSSRLLKCATGGDIPDFSRELENTGHQTWHPIQQPDWLLMEIENNLLVRPVQAEIASKMISPPSNKNSIMQLCMGEGKTSVIVPIVATALADGKRLVRVIVLKPLSGQMFQMLVQKLGGLINRRIFFMPFSRSVGMDMKKATLIRKTYQDFMRSRGVLLVQPEHILSFKLIGLEWLYNKTHNINNRNHNDNSREDGVADILLDTQRWLEENSRDILDESDEILNIRHELIYTIGNPKQIEGHPDRWLIVQEVFDLIRQHLRSTMNNARNFEVGAFEHPGCFPLTRILNRAAGQKLLDYVVSKIIDERLSTVPLRFWPRSKLRLAKEFITNPEISQEESGALLKYCGENNMPTGIMFLLRGLIAHEVLLFALGEKRWKVNYGLDLKRSMLAVPYRAKDSPAERAEFSHPDVAITLTCLSYYYGGLTESQLEICFRILFKSDSPTMEYERWLKGPSMRNKRFKHLSSINLEDKNKFRDDIFPIFRYNKSAIDFYLSRVVFPKEAREFPNKLSTSSWDIAAAKSPPNPTTGFSGTNDSRYLLPLSIDQIDTQEQRNTNARVLGYLLQPENKYTYTGGTNGERLNIEQLLQTLAKAGQHPRIRVLLDVGAQVLELQNEQVAEKWLGMIPEEEAQAAVFFSESDQLTVVTRDGTKEPLMVSAFAEQLDKCLVYLDEAHTRGTDLKIPIGSRAAVTLGPGLTKDRLVQACMRMRKLGHGHSVLFCGPPEIHRKILTIAQKDNYDSIEVRDVLSWCMEETSINACKLLPIWAKQGVGYYKRFTAWSNISNLKRFPNDLLEREAKPLQEHYGFRSPTKNGLDTLPLGQSSRHHELFEIRKRCDDFGVKSFHGAHMLEEQERQLSHEAECERENQTPPRANPAKHNIAAKVRRFIQTGTIPKSAAGSFLSAFHILSETSAAKDLERQAWSTKTLATLDFSNVIERRRGDVTNEFLRPVNWIVSSKVDNSIMVIMSPYEINELIPQIRQSRSVILHVYSPKVTKATLSYEELTFCTIPPVPESWRPNIILIDQLNIFAGQLYFQDFDTYQRVCGFLGLYLKEISTEDTDYVRSDGFVEQRDRQRLCKKFSPFSKSPVPLLRSLIGFRRKGQSYLATHMGQMLNGRQLGDEDFQDEQTSADKSNNENSSLSVAQGKTVSLSYLHR